MVVSRRCRLQAFTEAGPKLEDEYLSQELDEMIIEED
jgi:hypothetical protein